MDVFLVPVTLDRYEPYCEVPEAPEPDAALHPPRGPFHGFIARFQHMLASIERRAAEKTAATPTSLGGRLKERAYHWLAHWMAAQRLLWRLRKIDHATLVFPDDLEAARAHALLATHLDRESRRHVWMATLYAALGLVSIPVALVPGPNVFGYVFVFLLVGHFFSYRGARRGRTQVTWRDRSSATLVELRRLPSIAPADRERFIHEISERLGLAHLAAFFERLALLGA
jgi:hypothetical protein